MGTFRKLEAGGRIHILDQGVTFCGITPMEKWPEDDLWVAHPDEENANCDTCVGRFRYWQKVKGTKDASQ